MNDARPPLPPSDHPGTEALSASLDGLAAGTGAGDGVDGHVAGCAECRAVLDALAAARAAVGAPIEPPPAAVRDAAVAAANRAWSTARAAGAPGRGEATITPLAARRRPARLIGLGVAAAVAALLVAVPVLRQTDDGRSGGTNVASAPAETNVDGGRAADSSAPTELAQGFAAGGPPDLGAYADLASLQEAVRAVLVPPSAPSAVPPPDEAAPDQQDAADHGAGTMAASPEAQRRVGGSADPDCDATVRSRSPGDLGVLAYQATLEYRGQPAVVLAYATGPGGEPAGAPAYRLFIVAREGCRSLDAGTL